MKAILRSKKYLTAIIFSLVSVLTVALILPHVFALSDGKGELVQSKESDIAVESETQEEAILQQEETIPQQEGTVELQSNVNVEDVKTDNETKDKNPFKIVENNVEFAGKIFSLADEKTEEGRINPLKIYRTESKQEIMVDTVTNEIVEIQLGRNPLSEKIGKAQGKDDLKPFAEKFAAQLCDDFDKYDTYEITELGTGTSIVNFWRTIGGYKTSECIAVWFDSEFNIGTYYRTPDVFNGVDTSNIVIDENAVNQRIDNMYIQTYGDKYGSYKVYYESLTVKNSKIILELHTKALDKDGNEILSCAIVKSEIEIG